MSKKTIGPVIVKKFEGESAEVKRRFEQVAGIANTVKGHRNVSEFLRFYKKPLRDNDGQ